jgi:SAM-dependent methyltransferase
VTVRGLLRRGKRILFGSPPARILTREDSRELLARYSGAGTMPALSYATVRDYCDSSDHLPWLCRPDGDLKSVQRPWAVKAIVASVPPGSELLEIGAGVPEVAALLCELGFRVTAVDPYEGEANGPAEFSAIARAFPGVSLLRARFEENAAGLPAAGFDAVYSISVLEHLSPDSVSGVFAGIRRVLRPSGMSIHCVDHVIEGDGASWHEQIVRRVVCEQNGLAAGGPEPDSAYDELMRRIRIDLETFYLSALGHQRWRNGRSYDEFPFRKVVSVQLASPAEFPRNKLTAGGGVTTMRSHGGRARRHSEQPRPASGSREGADVPAWLRAGLDGCNRARGGDLRVATDALFRRKSRPSRSCLQPRLELFERDGPGERCLGTDSQRSGVRNPLRNPGCF